MTISDIIQEINMLILSDQEQVDQIEEIKNRIKEIVYRLSQARQNLSKINEQEKKLLAVSLLGALSLFVSNDIEAFKKVVAEGKQKIADEQWAKSFFSEDHFDIVDLIHRSATD